jgi:predicted RNase H-like nuclease (RuvC/YqgF family)
MNYYSPSRHYSGDEPEATDQREALTETIERVTRDAKHLADQFGEQVEYLKKRHGLIVEMMQLERHANQPIKVLEKRVALLQQIRNFGPRFEDEDLKHLEERIRCTETINRLEPNGEHASLKTLRERARLLERTAPLDEDAEA